jgi:hypothetical protein
VRHDARESRALFLFVFKLSTNAGIGAHARSHSDGNNERCTFAVQQTTQLSVTEWSIRNGDYLTVGGTQYSDGDNGALNGVQVTAGSQINWYVFLCCVVLCCVVLCCVVLCCVVLCCVVLCCLFQSLVYISVCPLSPTFLCRAWSARRAGDLHPLRPNSAFAHYILFPLIHIRLARTNSR